MNQVIPLHDAASDQEYEIPTYESKRDSFHEDINLASEENSIRNECVTSQNNAKVSYFPVKHDLSLEKKERDKTSGETTNGFISFDKNCRVICKNTEMNVAMKGVHGSEYTNAVAGPSGIPSRMVKKTDKEIFACGLCRQKFANSWEFDIHYQTHADKKTFVNKSTENVDFDEYCRIRTGKKSFVCEVCQKEFTHKSKLERHYRMHTGEKPFVCNICKRRLTQKEHLKRHYRMHTGEKSFVCKLCPKAFTRNSNLVRHYRTHTGEKSCL